jgi:hypothetical protein
MYLQLEEFQKHMIQSTAAHQHNPSFQPGFRNFMQKYATLTKSKGTTASHWEKRRVVDTFLLLFQTF